MYDIIFFTDIPTVLDTPSGRGYGAYRLATDLRKAGYSVITIDFCSALDFDDFKEILNLTMGDNTIFVGFSTTWFPYRPNNSTEVPHLFISNREWVKNGISYQFSISPNKFVNYIKEINPNCKVIVGGAKSFQYINEFIIDNVFIGFSENQIMEFLNSKMTTRIIDTDRKANIGPFNFNTSNTQYVETDCIHELEVLNFEFSRGCIFNCVFCNYPHKNQKTKNYTKYQDIIYNELLENYKKWGTTLYRITDDTFNDYTEKLQVINEVIQDLPFKPYFWSYVRQDLCGQQPDQIKLLYDIGVRETFYGMETWNETTAKIIRKGGSLKSKIDALKKCKEYWGNDVWTTTSFVIGLPEDTKEDWQNFANWYNNEGYKYIDRVALNVLVLRDFGDAKKYIFQSDIELNLEKYGYKMIDEVSWKRLSTNINSTEIAKNVYDEITAQINEKNFSRKNKLIYNPTKIYSVLTPNLSSTDAYYHIVKNYYKTTLIERIKNV